LRQNGVVIQIGVGFARAFVGVGEAICTDFNNATIQLTMLYRSLSCDGWGDTIVFG
jgi:hypothetical protein